MHIKNKQLKRIYIYIYIYIYIVSDEEGKLVSKNDWTTDAFRPKASG